MRKNCGEGSDNLDATSLDTRPAQDNTASSNKAVNAMANRIQATTKLAIELANHSAGVPTPAGQRKTKLLQHFKVKKSISPETNDADIDEPVTAGVHMDEHMWREAHAQWHATTYDADKNAGVVPNPKQTQVLELVHRRCVEERFPCTEAGGAPLVRLVHGLPGSGKSQLLKWLRSYFQQVWQWVEGREFVYIAPLNSMASNIGGSTVHSWGQIAFKDKRGVQIRPQQSLDSDTSETMSMKCGALRFLLTDEVEAVGAEIVGQLEHNVRCNISSKTAFRYDADQSVRLFGGVNTFFLGDFWQLRPTGQIAIMSNPFATKTLENARASEIMGMFWFSHPKYSLQPWQQDERMLHLDVNERSGADTWFSNVLDACRQGQLSEDDYNFLHGYPTEGRIEFWYHRRHVNRGAHEEPRCYYVPYHIHQYWDRYPSEKMPHFECLHCWTERRRRARVLHVETYPERAKGMLTHESFARAILITPFNLAVYYFAQQRAINFARTTGAAAFWIQATDSPPNWFANNLTRPSYSKRNVRGLFRKS